MRPGGVPLGVCFTGQIAGGEGDFEPPVELLILQRFSSSPLAGDTAKSQSLRSRSIAEPIPDEIVSGSRRHEYNRPAGQTGCPSLRNGCEHAFQDETVPPPAFLIIVDS
jgi:hypothetical protein